MSQLYGIFVPLNFSKTKIIRLILLLLWIAILMASIGLFIAFNYCEFERCAETLTTIGGSIIFLTVIINILMTWYGFAKQQRIT